MNPALKRPLCWITLQCSRQRKCTLYLVAIQSHIFLLLILLSDVLVHNWIVSNITIVIRLGAHFGLHLIPFRSKIKSLLFNYKKTMCFTFSRFENRRFSMRLHIFYVVISTLFNNSLWKILSYKYFSSHSFYFKYTSQQDNNKEERFYILFHIYIICPSRESRKIKVPFCVKKMSTIQLQKYNFEKHKHVYVHSYKVYLRDVTEYNYEQWSYNFIAEKLIIISPL